MPADCNRVVLRLHSHDPPIAIAWSSDCNRRWSAPTWPTRCWSLPRGHATARWAWANTRRASSACGGRAQSPLRAAHLKRTQRGSLSQRRPHHRSQHARGPNSHQPPRQRRLSASFFTSNGPPTGASLPPPRRRAPRARSLPLSLFLGGVPQPEQRLLALALPDDAAPRAARFRRRGRAHLFRRPCRLGATARIAIKGRRRPRDW